MTDSTVSLNNSAPPSGGVVVWRVALTQTHWLRRWTTATITLLILVACGDNDSSLSSKRSAKITKQTPEPQSAPQAPTALCSSNFVTDIARIQGSDTQSALVGRPVSVEGVVTGRLMDADGEPLGLFIQSASDDGIPGTSQGLFVISSQTFPTGSLLRAQGEVQEMGSGRSTRTALQANNIEQCGTAELPPALRISLPIKGRHIESLENMRVAIESPVTISGMGSVGYRGEIVISSGERMVQPTNVAAPGQDSAALASSNRKRSLTLDDGSLQQSNPRPLVRALFAAEPVPRVGDQLSAVQGILDNFAGYRLHLDQTPALTVSSQRPTLPAPSGNLRVASVNLLNYFNGDGAGGGFPTSRGAESPSEFSRQHRKLMKTLTTINADLYALAELENDGFDQASAIASLTSGLKQSGTPRRYQYRGLNEPLGDDEIAVGLVFDSATLTPTGPARTTTDYPFDDFNRQPLAQTFTHQASGETFTAIALHLKSKGCGEEASDKNRNLRDGQSCWNHKRLEAANFLVEWVKTIGADPARTLLVGDFNAYSMEDPITALQAAGYSNPLSGNESYSFVYRGAAGSLDHALIGEGLSKQLSGAQVWHINADEADWLSYRLTSKSAEEAKALYQESPQRSSDHDPLIVDFQFD